MAPGRYDWTFSVRLPPYIPASYEGQHGRVQYWAKAVLERRMKNDMDFTKNFTVLGALDLNTEPDAKVGTNIGCYRSIISVEFQFYEFYVNKYNTDMMTIGIKK